MVVHKTGHIARPATSSSPMTGFAMVGAELLAEEDPHLHGVLYAEHSRQEAYLTLLASASVTDPSVLSCMASVANNVTARSRPGTSGADELAAVEELAQQRARSAFGARYANVRPNSAVDARHGVLDALLDAGEVVLDVRLTADDRVGADLTAGYRVVDHHLDATGLIDYARIAAAARELRPRVLMCGGEPYPRSVDFVRLRAVADEVGALLLVDISHIAGLVLTGLHPSPVDEAHVVTACTHTQLAGPQGGLVLCGREADMVLPDGRTLSERLREQTSWSRLGAPAIPAIAGKARALDLAQTDTYRDILARTVAGTAELVAELRSLHHRIVGGGTDNHIVVLDPATRTDAGRFAELALREVNIVVEPATMPGGGAAGSALRIDMTSAGQRGFGSSEMRQTAQLLDAVLGGLRLGRDGDYQLEEFTRASVTDATRRLLSRFPLPRYVPVARWSAAL